MKVWMLFLLLFTYSAFSSEFMHIKLNPEFEKYLTQPQAKSNPLGKRNQLLGHQFNQEKILNTLLGPSPQRLKGQVSFETEESPLYDQIRRHLETTHASIGLSEVENINRINQSFNLGSSNFSGFSWQKPFGVIQIHADRQVTPNIFVQNWLVMDTFSIEIEASTFLEKLNEAGLTSMSLEEIGFFSGISFRRTYTYWHYANSYQEGLRADFSKLFLPFLKFNLNQMDKMGSEEILKREDIWTAAAGGLITTPPFYNVSFSGGILSENDFQNTISIQNNGDSIHRFKVGTLSKRNHLTGASLELQIDFLKLIKLSLLRYDLNYEYAGSREFTLGFTTDQWNKLKKTPEESNELRSVLNGLGKIQKLENHIVRLDESQSSAFEQKSSFLIWGRMQKQKTEQIKVIMDSGVKNFHKSYAQNIKVVQNVFKKFFSAIIYKVFKLPIGMNDAAVYSRQINLEFESTHPQSVDPKVERVRTIEDFSLDINQYYQAQKTDKWINRKFKNDLIWFVDNFTTLPKSYKTDIRNEVLLGPMLIESHARIEKAGFRYLVETNENNFFEQLVNICKSSKREEWKSEVTRKEMLEEEQFENDACVKNLGLSYLDFKKDYLINNFAPSLKKFKEFIKKYYKKTRNLDDLDAIFGADNVFIHGKLEGKTSQGATFKTTFSSGQFRGLGVIDNFKRNSGSRMPASIISE